MIANPTTSSPEGNHVSKYDNYGGATHDPVFDMAEQPDPICTTSELSEHLGAYEPTIGSIRRRVYKDTACGASLGIMDGNEWVWRDSSDYAGPVYGLAMSGYVEDCDMDCPVHTYDPDKDGDWRKWLDWAMKQVDADADDVAAEWAAMRDEETQPR